MGSHYIIMASGKRSSPTFLLLLGIFLSLLLQSKAFSRHEESSNGNGSNVSTRSLLQEGDRLLCQQGLSSNPPLCGQKDCSEDCTNFEPVEETPITMVMNLLSMIGVRFNDDAKCGKCTQCRCTNAICGWEYLPCGEMICENFVSETQQSIPFYGYCENCIPRI